MLDSIDTPFEECKELLRKSELSLQRVHVVLLKNVPRYQDRSRVPCLPLLVQGARYPFHRGLQVRGMLDLYVKCTLTSVWMRTVAWSLSFERS